MTDVEPTDDPTEPKPDDTGDGDAGAEPTVEELRKEKEELEQRLDESRKAMEELRRQNDSLSKGPSAKSWVLDITVGECEFASAFAYFLEVQLEGHEEKRQTDVSLPAERPVFANGTLLLSVGASLKKERLKVSAFLNVVDPSNPGSPSAKLLGAGLLSLDDLQVPENGTASKRLVRNVSFTRTESEGKELIVGRSTIVIQMKALNPETAKSSLPTAATVESALAPSLDKSLWQAKPFESRLRVLVHRADALPVLEESSQSIFRAAVRLLQPGGHVVHEVASRSLKVAPITSSLGQISFNQEILLPLSTASDASSLQVGLALEMISSTADGVSTDSLLNLQWSPSTLPMLFPVHLYARATGSATYSRPRPGILVSITREPDHDALDRLGDGMSHGVDVRVHGVPAGRPLPESVEDAIVAICPESSIGSDTRNLQVPMITYYYDQRVDLNSFLEAHFVAASGMKCFLTPMARSSQTPQWGQFSVRCLAAPSALRNLALLLFDCSQTSTDPDAPLSGRLLGFASVDATALIGSKPVSRSFLADLRLLEAPGASTSVEVEVRVWPRGGFPQSATASPVKAVPSAAATGVSAALEQEAKDFKLNHELSVQLSKEFNLRAAALKRAGEEIVALRRQVQLLKNENKSLRSQIEDEERLAEDVLKEVNRARGLERSLDELQQVHLEQNRELQRLQEEGKKLETYRQTAKTQEKVISKLEKILENSLQEVQKAQKVQVDIERLKTENLKLRERCTSLLTRKKDLGSDEAQELRQSLAQKDAEIARLQKLAGQLRDGRMERTEEMHPLNDLHDLHEHERVQHEVRQPLVPQDVQVNRSQVSQVSQVTQALSPAEQEQLAHIEAKRFEWEQRCVAAEQRLQMLQQQLTESSKRYGSDISSLEVEIAKKDARIKELEFLVKQHESG